MSSEQLFAENRCRSGRVAGNVENGNAWSYSLVRVDDVGCWERRLVCGRCRMAGVV